jgi:hypothetical protein
MDSAGSDRTARPSEAFGRVRQALRPRALPEAPRPLAEAASALAALGAGSVLGVLFFGSQRTKARPDRFSAYDLFVVVDAYGPFYRALAATGRVRRPPGVLAVLNALLTPSQISLHLPDGGGGELHAKCSVIALRDLQRETGERRRDHFTIGRLFQPVEMLWVRDDGVREALLDTLASAAVNTLAWGRPSLPDRFDTDTYLRTLLRVSMGREVRPEPTGLRADTLHEAQRSEQLPVYRALLEALARAGALREVAGGSGAADRSKAPGAPDPPGPAYELIRPVSLLERLRVGLYFRVSTARATLRWFKYMITFDDWLEYIRHKAERHTGQAIELSAREKAYPFLFLWPRVFRYLRDKERAEPKVPPDTGGVP